MTINVIMSWHKKKQLLHDKYKEKLSMMKKLRCGKIYFAKVALERARKYCIKSRARKCANKGGVDHIFCCCLKKICLLHCVPLYVCRLCINFQELCARLLGMATLRIRSSPSFHALLIDFLSIKKVIIFSAIATDDRHPLRSRSIHQNAANCMTIRFRYIAQPRGVRKTYCARSRK